MNENPSPHTNHDQSSQFNLLEWKRNQELGLRRYNREDVLSHLYCNISRCHAFHPSRTINHTSHGGIFNFDFSTDGSILLAACERKSFLMFDPLNGKLTGSRTQAHNDCVNYIRFLDSRVFATCSDDTTVRLWDARHLKHSIRTLHGHSNWVKNIEYDRQRGLLLSSGFDGSIYAWDINSYCEGGSVCRRVFHTNGLMRTKLTPDAGKLIISTAGGYLMIIHDLDLGSLSDDLHGFKPNMYRMMQLAKSPIRNGYHYNHVFRGRRNRVEFVTDFPEGNDAEVLSSLQVHPQGWAVCTRNISSDENSEWTCVHDIQSYPAEGALAGEPSADFCPDSAPHSEPNSPNLSRSASPSFFLYIAVDEGGNSPLSSPTNPRSPAANLDPSADPSEENSGQVSDSVQDSGEPNSGLPEIPDTGHRTINSSQDNSSSTNSVGGSSTSQENPVREGRSFYIANTRQDSIQLLKPSRSAPVRIYENRPRLQYYIEEPNVGRGFIKVMGFSQDGRVLCSPFGYGTRLLALDSACSELCDKPNPPGQARTFTELGFCRSHQNVVLCTKFSPTHCLFVSGCLGGEVMFHQPVL